MLMGLNLLGYISLCTVICNSGKAQSFIDVHIMAQSYDTITSLLSRIGRRHLIGNFKTQRIDNIDTCKRLADTDLLSLGLSTIGDRARFRAEITASHENASPGGSWNIMKAGHWKGTPDGKGAVVKRAADTLVNTYSRHITCSIMIV